MKEKRIITLGLMVSLLMTSVLGGCGKPQENTSETTGAQTETQAVDDGGKEQTGDTAADVSEKDLLTLEVYDVAANYQGIQSGWFGKVLKDKFNIELNIIAPNVAGDAASLYQTRSASGYLGDIIILDNADFVKCVDAGLVADISSEVENYENLMKYYEQIQLYNEMISDDGSAIYGIPAQMNSNGPTSYVEPTVYSTPRIPWDFYSELGNPELNTLADLLNVLEEIQTAHPTNESGDKAYALSLWSDWDNPTTNAGIEVVNQLTKWYGQEVQGSILLGTDGSISPVTDKEGAYYKMLKFMFEANQRGLVDPDSGTQDWNAANAKMKNKQLYLFWYNWQRNFWNTPERANEGDAYVTVPVADMEIYQPSNTYYGDGRVWGLDANLDDEKKTRILELLDWLATSEGLRYQHVGLEGLIYTVQEDGKIALTEDGYSKDTVDIQVPEELGGGLYLDGDNDLNQWIVGSAERDPLTGESYDVNYLSATLEANESKMSQEWSELYGAENEVEYYQQNGQLDIVPSVNLILDSDTTDMALIRSQCGDLVCDTSWQLIYAGSEEAFESGWATMKETLNGLGWEQLVEFDTQKYQDVVDARAAAQ